MIQEEYREGLEELAAHYKDVLTLLGEDPSREGLEKTPMRVAKAMPTRCSPMPFSVKTTRRWSS